MLSQKGICGLIVLCCCLAYSSQSCTSCWKCVQEEAEKLEKDVKDFLDIPNTEARAFNTQLPNCSDSHNNTRHIVKAFHSLFQELNNTIDGAVTISSLQRNIQQQHVCLQGWQVSDSPINIICKEENEVGRKMLLVEASKRYNCLMRQIRNV